MAIIKFLKTGAVMDVPMRREGNRLELELGGSAESVKDLISEGFQELNENNNDVMGDYSNYRHLYHAQAKAKKFTVTNDVKDVYTPQPRRPVGIELIGKGIG